MGGLFGGGSSAPPQPTRSAKGVRIITPYGERTPMSGGLTNINGRMTTIGAAQQAVADNSWPPKSSYAAGGSN